MKLNYNCIRDVLLFIEENQEMTDNGYMTTMGLHDFCNSDSLSNYSESDIEYCISKLHEAGFVDANDIRSLDSSGFMIKDITYDGHQYLNNIRDKSIWQQTLEKVRSVGGSVSLSVLSQIAEKIVLSKLGLS